MTTQDGNTKATDGATDGDELAELEEKAKNGDRQRTATEQPAA